MRQMRFICIQHHGQTWYLDSAGEWSEHAEELLTFNNVMEAIAYMGVRGLCDHRVCICHDRGKDNASPARSFSADS